MTQSPQPTPSTTTAVVVAETGGPEVLQLQDTPVREPGAGEAVVAVAAAGVNFIDIYQRSGVYPLPLPFVSGSEGAGTVLAVGDGVDEVAVGQRVAWSAVPGSYAGVVTGPAAALVPVPDGVDDQQAAALPLQGMTAHYLLRDSYPVRPGDTVLVHAGAGGVGLLLTQMAVTVGATVITTVSNQDKAELSRGAGAAHVIVSGEPGYGSFDEQVRELTGGEGVHAVYDGVGKDTFEASLRSLRRRGILVLFGGASGQVPPFDVQRLNGLGSLSITRPTLKDFTVTREEILGRMAEIFDWVAAGKLSTRIGATYPLADAAQAHEDLAGRRTTGKLLLLP